MQPSNAHAMRLNLPEINQLWVGWAAQSGARVLVFANTPRGRAR
jgi:hypothetical protein